MRDIAWHSLKETGFDETSTEKNAPKLTTHCGVELASAKSKFHEFYSNVKSNLVRKYVTDQNFATGIVTVALVFDT